MEQDTLFLQEKLKEFGLQDASEEERELFFAAAGEAILTQVAKKIGVALPEDQQEEFFQLFERPTTDEEMRIFFQTYVPNFRELLVEEVARFKAATLKHDKQAGAIDLSAEIK